MHRDVSGRVPILASASPRRASVATARFPGQSSLDGTAKDALLIMAGGEHVGMLHCASDVWAARHGVDVAIGVDQGLRLLEQGRYRVLVLDLQPDGLRVLHMLRTCPVLRPPAVLVLGTMELKDQVWGAIEAGADDYLTLPCDIHDLALRVELWLRRVGNAASNGHPGLRIQSLGRFRVTRAGKLCLQETGRARKVNMLFKYLLAHHEQTVHTGEVFELLWPEEDEKVAATDLRSLLHQLRKMLGSGANGGAAIHHTVTSLGLHLCPSDWWDVHEFTAWIREAAHQHKAGDTACALQAYEAAIDLYAGDFLSDDRYVEWVAPIRDRLREQWLRALSAVATLRAEQGDYEAQEAALRALVAADPYREHNSRLLMELLAAQGRGAEALVLYRKLRDLLNTQLGAQPDPETQTLAAYIGQRSI